MYVIGDLAPGPEVMQAQIALQAIGDPGVQLGDGEYLGQDGAIGQADYLRAVHGQGETEEIENIGVGFVPSSQATLHFLD